MEGIADRLVDCGSTSFGHAEKGLRMSVRDTSIKAYREQRDSGAMTRQRTRLLAAIPELQDFSRLELSELCGIRLSSVCSLVNRMIKDGALVERPTRPCKITGRTIHPVARPAGEVP